MMSNIRFTGIKTTLARHFQRGGDDAYGNPPEQTVSNSNSNPCRHCLNFIREGEAMLVVALRPFQSTQPYAETGPALLHAEECTAFEGQAGELPPVLYDSPEYLTRAYNSEERIIYGTGGVTPYDRIQERASDLLGSEPVEFVDVRSSFNNCWQARIVRQD